MPDFCNSLRNEFRRQLISTTGVDLLLKDNNTEYIKWLENKIYYVRVSGDPDYEETNNSNKEDS